MFKIGDKVRYVNEIMGGHARLNPGAVYEVAGNIREHGDEYVQLVGKFNIRNHAELEGFAVERFELVERPVAPAIIPEDDKPAPRVLQVGDKVILKVWENTNKRVWFSHGNMERCLGEATVRAIHPNTNPPFFHVKENHWRWDLSVGFTFADEQDDREKEPEMKDAEHKFKKDQWVVWEQATTPFMTRGKAYKVVDVGDRLIGVTNDKGNRGFYFGYRFNPWVPKVGDMVKVVANPGPKNVPEYDRFINDGVAYRIEKLDRNGVGWAQLDNEAGHEGWFIRVKGLEPANAEGPAMPLEAPVQGFNARVKGMVAAKKKMPVKPSKAAIMKQRNEQLLKHRTDLQEKTKGHEAASYAVCFSDGNVAMRNNTACHMGLSYPGGNGEVVAVYDHVSKFYNNKDKIPEGMKPSFKKFVLFLMKRSPIAHAFKTKTWTEAEKLGMSLDVSKTGSEIAVACCSLRFAHEHGGRIQVWDWCLKNKFDELTAYFMMNVAYMCEKEFFLNTRNWHNIVDGDKSFGGIIAGMVNGFHDKGGEPYSKKQTYQVSRLVHLGGVGETLNTHLKGILKMKNAEGGVWGAAGPSWTEAQFHTVCKHIQAKLKHEKQRGVK